MKIINSIPELADIPGPLCVAIGVFDGVHLGHQALIRRALDEAAKIGGSAVVLTFDPHPVRVLRPETAPRLLTSTEHKIHLIEKLGCSNLLLLQFDLDFAAQPPEVFIEKLAEYAKPLKSICVGHQWVWGRNRAGNIDLLQKLGARLGFESIEIDPVMAGGGLVSSTRIRKAVEAGDLTGAKRMLGRDYTIFGTVQHGEELGRKLGFPTANLAAHNEQFPPNGVYAVRITRPGQTYNGVANIGYRPTVEHKPERLLEVYIFDFNETIYGENLEVDFVKFLRLEKKFGGLEELKYQIGCDVEEAKSALR